MDTLVSVLCICGRQAVGSDAEAALKQHSEACAPLRQLAVRYGQTWLQLAQLFGEAQHVPDAAVARCEAFAPAVKAATYAATCSALHAAATDVSFKSLVSSCKVLVSSFDIQPINPGM